MATENEQMEYVAQPMKLSSFGLSFLDETANKFNPICLYLHLFVGTPEAKLNRNWIPEGIEWR